MTVDEKRKLELKTMYQIIGIYCHNKHHTPKGQLCEACEQVWEYAEHRIDACPHMESKTFCSVCKTHCYAPNYREKSVKLCVMVDQGCYWYRRSKSLDICILNGKTKKEASHASLFLMVLSRFHVIILCDCFVQYSFD